MAGYPGPSTGVINRLTAAKQGSPLGGVPSPAGFITELTVLAVAPPGIAFPSTGGGLVSSKDVKGAT